MFENIVFVLYQQVINLEIDTILMVTLCEFVEKFLQIIQFRFSNIGFVWLLRLIFLKFGVKFIQSLLHDGKDFVQAGEEA